MFHLNNKVALIPDGGSSIGRAVSLLFVQQGAVDFLSHVDEQGGTASGNEMQAQNGQGFFSNAMLPDRNR